MDANNELPGPDEKLYNLDKVKEISRGNEAFVKRMIHIFSERLPGILAQIKDAYNSKDYKKVYDLAHLLKPSIDNMGIVAIKRNIRNIEDLAIENPSSELLLENINKIDIVLMIVFEQLKDELK